MKSLFKRIRFSLRFLKGSLERHQRLIFVGFLVGLVSFLYLPKLFKFILQRETLKIGIVGKYTQSELPLYIQQKISEGLTSVTPDGQITPRIAESWEVLRDGQEYIFTLRKNLHWHDNTPVLANDIDFNFSDVTTAPLGTDRVKFLLKEPFAPFLSVVAQPLFKKTVIGTGEYKVSRIIKRGQVVEKLVLVPFKDSSKKTIIYRFYPTEEAAITAFKLGEINTIEMLNNPGDIKEWENVVIEPKVMTNRFVALFFNTQLQKLSDKSTRQALAYAIEKRWEPRALTPINPDSWVFNNGVKPYDLDLENAKKLLEKSQDNGTDTNRETPTEIELSAIPSLLDIAEEIQKDWGKIGITTRIRIISSLDEPYEALLINQEIPSDPDQYVYWHSTQKLNLSHYKSPKIDKLLEDGRKTIDLEKRKEIYLDFQRFLVEDSPAVFLFHTTVYNISRK